MTENESFLKYLDNINMPYSTYERRHVFSNNSKKYTIIEIEPDELIRRYLKGRKIEGVTVTKKNINHGSFTGIEFTDCHFIEIDFHVTDFYICSFQNCTFKKCSFSNLNINQGSFHNVKFENCDMIQALITDTKLVNVAFVECNELIDTIISSCQIVNLSFVHCFIINFTIERYVSNAKKAAITYENCDIQESEFRNTDLINVVIKGSRLSQIVITNTKIHNNTIKGCTVEDEKFCSIDLQSIIQSDLSEEVYKLFGVHNAFIKDYIKELVSEAKFQSVFISYSFKNQVFAGKLNQLLRSNGINTFLWEEDAPGGKRLNKIMSDNIRKYDRVLFIASENSIKSEACQYELTVGRMKQDENWKDIFYPIHIDNYLFAITKDDIRPKEKREEYWLNIENVKEYNSMDFSKFNTNIEDAGFEEAVRKLIKDLKV